MTDAVSRPPFDFAQGDTRAGYSQQSQSSPLQFAYCLLAYCLLLKYIISFHQNYKASITSMADNTDYYHWRDPWYPEFA